LTVAGQRETMQSPTHFIRDVESARASLSVG
jgi:hypothetical protein